MFHLGEHGFQLSCPSCFLYTVDIFLYDSFHIFLGHDKSNAVSAFGSTLRGPCFLFNHFYFFVNVSFCSLFIDLPRLTFLSLYIYIEEWRRNGSKCYWIRKEADRNISQSPLDITTKIGFGGILFLHSLNLRSRLKFSNILFRSWSN